MTILAKGSAIILASFLTGVAWATLPGVTSGLCTGALKSNVVIDDGNTPNVPTLRPLDSELARTIFSFSEYPEIAKVYNEDGIVLAGTLSRWRKESFKRLMSMPDIEFRNILQDTMATYRNDKQFNSESRQRYLAAIDAWIEARAQRAQSVEKKFEAVILTELVGRTVADDGVDFQPIQADFRNMMGIASEADLRAAIPRAAVPVVFSAFMLRNFPNAPELFHGEEGSLRNFIHQFMQ